MLELLELFRVVDMCFRGRSKTNHQQPTTSNQQPTHNKPIITARQQLQNATSGKSLQSESDKYISLPNLGPSLFLRVMLAAPENL